MDSENQIQVATKQKSEGRVRAGKQLAEWNKKNKENLIKNKTQDNPSEKSSNLSSAEKASSYLSSNHYYYGLSKIKKYIVKPLPFLKATLYNFCTYVS